MIVKSMDMIVNILITDMHAVDFNVYLQHGSELLSKQSPWIHQQKIDTKGKGVQTGNHQILYKLQSLSVRLTSEAAGPM